MNLPLCHFSENGRKKPGAAASAARTGFTAALFRDIFSLLLLP